MVAKNTRIKEKGFPIQSKQTIRARTRNSHTMAYHLGFSKVQQKHIFVDNKIPTLEFLVEDMNKSEDKEKWKWFFRKRILKNNHH